MARINSISEPLRALLQKHGESPKSGFEDRDADSACFGTVLGVGLVGGVAVAVANAFGLT